MNMQEILSKCDHTLLSQTATWGKSRPFVMTVCTTRQSVCIPASYVRQAKEYGETVWLFAP